jgi:uncharacterized membrane protein (UPF0127 family)
MKRSISVENLTHPLSTPLQAGWCDSFLCRLRGLTFRRKIPAEEGLLLVYSADSRANAAIHMLGVFFDLGIVWINRECVVVDTCLARRWHPFYQPKAPAAYILEIHPARLGDFTPGDRIRFVER